jgi:hypothetical protein
MITYGLLKEARDNYTIQLENARRAHYQCDGIIRFIDELMKKLDKTAEQETIQDILTKGAVAKMQEKSKQPEAE